MANENTWNELEALAGMIGGRGRGVEDRGEAASRNGPR